LKFYDFDLKSFQITKIFDGMLSTCGAIIRARRARLTATTVEALLFKMENNIG